MTAGQSRRASESTCRTWPGLYDSIILVYNLLIFLIVFLLISYFSLDLLKAYIKIAQAVSSRAVS